MPNSVSPRGGVSALANPWATLLLLAFGPSRWRWLAGGASREEVETAFAGWEMLAVEPADTAALGWPMNKTAPRGTGCGDGPSVPRQATLLGSNASLTVHKQHLVSGVLGSCHLREHALQPTVARGRATWTTRP